MVIKDQLKSARELHGLTQEALAKKCLLKMSQISAFETGRRNPSVHNLVKLADALNVSADYLLGRESYGTPMTPSLQALLALASSLKKKELDLLLQIASSIVAGSE